MTVGSGMIFRRADVHMGNDEDEYSRKTVDPEKVLALREIIDNLNKTR